MKKQVLSIAGIIVATTLVNASAMPMGDSMMMHTNTSSMMSANFSISNNLKMGSMGDDVMSLQTFLESKGHLTMPQGLAKGYFGKLTQRALIRYQSSVGLPATGYYGAMTRAKMNAGMGMSSDNTMSGGSMMAKEDGVMVGGALMVANKDIVDNAVNANNVTTVVAAVKAAGLVDTLKSAGPFTVFAPTNSAFAALPAGTVATLLLPENKATLIDILTYHVVAGRYTSSDLTDGLVLKTVEGKTLKFKKVNGQLMINGKAIIETANVISSNGVTHVINSVLMPGDAQYVGAGVEVGGALMVANKDIVDNALSASNVTTVVAAVKAAGLVDTLKSAGPFTVFAPTNNAFAALPAGTVATLLLPENKAKLAGILTYHVVAGAYTTKDLYDGQSLKTVQGQSLAVSKKNGIVTINGAAMIETPNVISSNGVTHVINSVLLPQ